MKYDRIIISFCLPLLFVYISTGCNRAVPQTSTPKPPEVIVVKPQLVPYQEFEEFTGRVAATKMVDIKARVSGYLDKIYFVDGATVNEKTLLFQIDPRPYQAEVDRAEATVLQAQTRLSRTESQKSRGDRLIQTNAIAQEQVETLAFDRDEALAQLRSAEASLETAKLNLHYTTVFAPITGKISRHLVDIGGLIKADDTTLANIVSINPIDVYFDMDERTVLRLKRESATIADTSGRSEPIEVEISLSDKNDYSLRGLVDFTDNQIEAGTGTLRLRAKVENQSELLLPGMFVRCRFPIGKKQPVLFIPEEALGSDQGIPFVYVVDDAKKVQYRKVEIGALNGNKRVIRSNLGADETIVVSGLQRVRAGIEVNPQIAEQLAEQQRKQAEVKNHNAKSMGEKETDVDLNKQPEPAKSMQK